MSEIAKGSKLPLLLSGLAIIVAASALFVSLQTQNTLEQALVAPQLTPTPTPTPTTVNIKILRDENTKKCSADPWDPDIQAGSEVCFKNEAGIDVTLIFDDTKEVIEGGVEELPIKAGDKGCIRIKEHISGGLDVTLEYDILDDKGGVCSETTNRPRIIINP